MTCVHNVEAIVLGVFSISQMGIPLIEGNLWSTSTVKCSRDLVFDLELNGSPVHSIPLVECINLMCGLPHAL